jgi:hypothetical protein
MEVIETLEYTTKSKAVAETIASLRRISAFLHECNQRHVAAIRALLVLEEISASPETTRRNNLLNVRLSIFTNFILCWWKTILQAGLSQSSPFVIKNLCFRKMLTPKLLVEPRSSNICERSCTAGGESSISRDGAFPTGTGSVRLQLYVALVTRGELRRRRT